MKTECKAALDKILAYYGTKAEMGRQFEVSRNCIGYWFTRGQVGRDSVLKVASMPGHGLTASQIRPDLSW